ncbi:MAG: MFS transporter [Caldilineaceae bacterium]|nr:MFS transporter [Caldilineaceae bacterium]
MNWQPLRWILRLDDVIPERTDADVEAEVLRNYRWNFTVNLFDGGFFFFGLSFASSTTILPLFVSKLSDNPLLIGVLAVLAQAGWYLPQLFTAGAIERTARKKPWVVNLGLITERVPVMIWPLAALLALVSPVAALALFFVTFALHQLGAGLIAPAWQDMIAACFPVNRRGRFMGTMSFLGTAAGAAGAVLSGRILEEQAFPYNFAILFGLAALFIFLSWFALALTREPARAVDAETLREVDIRSRIGRVLRNDHRFRRFFIVRLLITLGAMGLGFVTVAAVTRFDLPDQTVGYFTVALLIGQTVGNLVLGLLADRFGHKLSLELGALMAALAFALAWWAPSADWFYAIFFLLGAHTASTIVSGLMIVMEYADRTKRPTYAGITNTGLGAVNMAAPLIGGWIALMGYGWLFAVSTVVALAGAVLLRFWVQDPRHVMRDA